MISEEIKAKLFDKDFDGDYRVFFIALIDEANTLSRHMSEVKTSSLVGSENIRSLFQEQKKIRDDVDDLTERDLAIEKISNQSLQTSKRSLQMSVIGICLILIIGWQTTPVTIERIGKVAAWVIDKL